MVQFECCKVIYPLLSFTFGVHCGVSLSISLYAGKGKCWMWPVNKVAIHIAKICFVHCKWSNSNAPGSYSRPYVPLRQPESAPLLPLQQGAQEASEVRSLVFVSGKINCTSRFRQPWQVDSFPSDRVHLFALYISEGSRHLCSRRETSRVLLRSSIREEPQFLS